MASRAGTTASGKSAARVSASFSLALSASVLPEKIVDVGRRGGGRKRRMTFCQRYRDAGLPFFPILMLSKKKFSKTYSVVAVVVAARPPRW